jgi:hypothetical protein
MGIQIEAKSSVVYFLAIVLPIIIVVFGFLNNIVTFSVFSRKRFLKMPGKNMIRLVSVVDTLCLIFIIRHFIWNVYSMLLYYIIKFGSRLISHRILHIYHIIGRISDPKKVYHKKMKTLN